jgi:thioredoxin-like negative regulator of GroEL
MVGTMTELTHASFLDFVSGNRFVVVHFWAKWNNCDSRMKSILVSQIPKELGTQVAFGMLDTDPAEHHDLCTQHKILNLPYLAFYRDGSLVLTLTGTPKPEEIIGCLQELVQ